MRRTILLWFCCATIVAAQQTDERLRTVAETSDWKATARHADVMDFCNALAEISPVVNLEILGKTFEGRDLPMLILADPPIATPEEARASGKLVFFAFGNIHSGEVCGKEGLMLLAREIGTTPNHPLLRDTILLFAPILNADGNERMSPRNRPGQDGPEQGMGTRPNAQGLNMNRDWTKLEAPGNRAFTRAWTRWDPAVIIDLHTTNGSRHQYILTFDAQRHPAGDARVLEYGRDKLLPAVSAAMEAETGYKSFFYGNFGRGNAAWSTYEGMPRFTTHYGGLRNRISILSEAYSYAPYKERVMGTLEFVRHIAKFAQANKSEIQTMMSEVDAATIEAGNNPREGDLVALRSRHEVMRTVTVLGLSGGEPQTVEAAYDGASVATVSAQRPYAYLIPPSFASAIEVLREHGAEVRELRGDVEADVEVYAVNSVQRAGRGFEGHQMSSVEVTKRAERRRVPAGTIEVRTGQKLGNLIVFLLEPESEDGLCAWNFFDDGLAEGGDYPVLRVPKPTALYAGDARPLAHERETGRRITYRALYGDGPRPNLGGSPASGLRWLDAERYLHRFDGETYAVEARTGRAEPYEDPIEPGAMKRALAADPATSDASRRFGDSTDLTLDPQGRGAFFLSDNDLYYAALDGARVARLTQTPDDDERWAEFSPDGRFVAFIRSHDLYVVDVATQSERRLTEGGDETLSNGETNWVYMEEVFGRGNKKAFWWSPDSMRLAFLQFDDAPVYEFTLIDHIPDVQRVERSRYPKPGEPNPWARLGVVRTGGGEIGWADLSERPREDTLVTRVGWTPDSSRVWFYIQDRAQKFLDFMTVSPNGGAPRKLFRDENGRWVAIPGLPTWLDDGSFLLFSERTGWKHIYHYSGDGRLRGQVTDGPWEVTGIEHVDKANGVVFFSGTRDSHIARNLYRVNLDGSDLRRLTFGPGTHNASISPDGATFIDTWSDVHSPAKIALFDANAGRLIRTIDDNPAHEREEWDLGRYELVQIPTADGFVLEGSLLYPPDFDPSAKHPVWFQTYGGPHSPRIRNAFNARERDELLANWGLIVFYADPRSASGKGAVSTWTAYKNFGVIERDDIATAIEWLKEKPFIDGERIGMQGHSYGGFMTSYMMTHGDLFKAGIAGAPVTDWRLYDTIYTERYMDTPQRNPEGYDATSVILAAENLHGRLLIGHGLIDDNVHFQNTVRLVDALQRANKQNFEVMFYPRSRHGIGGDHYRDLQLNFIRREMLGLGPVGAMN